MSSSLLADYDQGRSLIFITLPQLSFYFSDNMIDARTVLAYCMLAILCYVLIKVLRFVRFMIRCYVLPTFGVVENLRKFGSWAVITGSTDGIGKAYAEGLAKRGFNIVLVSRTKEKLDKVSVEIKERYGVETKVIQFDFATPDGYDLIKDEISDLDVGILVNNVGIAGEVSKFYDCQDMKIIINVAFVNMFGELNLTHMLMQGMVKRKRGVVVHVSSDPRLNPWI